MLHQGNGVIGLLAFMITYNKTTVITVFSSVHPSNQISTKVSHHVSLIVSLTISALLRLLRHNKPTMAMTHRHVTQNIFLTS